jgi:hypothetical protein
MKANVIGIIVKFTAASKIIYCLARRLFLSEIGSATESKKTTSYKSHSRSKSVQKTSVLDDEGRWVLESTYIGFQ